MDKTITTASHGILSQIRIRALEQQDLSDLEWDGAYTHYRRLFRIAYERLRARKGLAWIVDHPEYGMIGQVFIQLVCNRFELADGISRAYLYSFRVKPPFRRQGIGRTLLDFCESDLRERQLQFVTLNVARDNRDAIRLYQNRGYEIVTPEPGIWDYQDHMGVWHQVIEPAWRMQKKLVL